MLQDPSPAVLDRVRLYTVGFAKPGGEPSAMGTGVAIKAGDLYGILTCAHVDQFLRQNVKVGVVSLNRGMSIQASMIDVRDIFSHAWGAPPWDVSAPDLCFMQLTPDVAKDLEARSTFLDWDRNLVKVNAPPPTKSHLDAVCGMVEEFSGPTTRENGFVTTRLRAVLTPGQIVAKDEFTSTLECLARNDPDLPDTFGGSSGGGLWRAFLRFHDDGTPELAEFLLRGIASQQDLAARPTRIICQGLGRLAAVIAEARGRASEAME